MFEQYLAHQQDALFILILGGMLLMLPLERRWPRKAGQKDPVDRWLNNFGLALLNQFLLFGLAFVLVASASLVWLRPETTLFDRLGWPLWAMLLSATLVMEFVSYWLHRALHQIPWLWRIHAVHHNDVELDATSAHRHHPFEALLSGLIALPPAIWLGIPIEAIAIFNLLRVFATLFGHINIRLPERLDSVLRLFIVTPDFHRMHHSTDRQFTDSNYGIITPWFDYLFGTATRKPYRELETMQIGLETLRSPKDSRFDRLLSLPFLWRSKVPD